MATYPDDAIPNSTTATFSSMIDRKPDRGYSYERAYDVISFTSEAGYERRSLRSRRPKRQYSLSYSNVSGLVRQAIENFYTARSGSFESFILDLAHLGDTGTIYVRFDGNLSITERKSGLETVQNVYDISFDLIETYT